jgi:hypothetical protein
MFLNFLFTKFQQIKNFCMNIIWPCLVYVILNSRFFKLLFQFSTVFPFFPFSAGILSWYYQCPLCDSIFHGSTKDKSVDQLAEHITRTHKKDKVKQSFETII